SSPNTPGLRDLQGAARLSAILRAGTCHMPHSPPVLIKIAPDLSAAGLASVVQICIERGVQGLVISNTSIHRPGTLRSLHASEAGGLSGRPLFASSTALLARAHLLARGRLTLVGVGGIFSGQDALIKIKAGATLVQLYTALVFDGPAIVTRIRIELAAALRREGFVGVADAVGVEASRLAEGIS
ncbi:MAG: dihydroorotate dehydrogenase (quinone), partial [Acetobacteraceae bacterium]